MSQYKGKIVSIQALRALAFLGIFFSHAGAQKLKWPYLGVSIFYVLSGYLLFWQYEKKDIACSIKDNMRFSWSKIKKLYPLHIVTMGFAIVLSLITIMHNGLTRNSIAFLIGCIVLNVTLIQSWIPYSSVNVSLNGVAWYLSVTVFLYFVFPYIKRWINNKRNSYLSFLCMLILVLEILICIPMVVVLGESNPIYIYMVYVLFSNL